MYLKFVTRIYNYEKSTVYLRVKENSVSPKRPNSDMPQYTRHKILKATNAENLHPRYIQALSKAEARAWPVSLNAGKSSQ